MVDMNWNRIAQCAFEKKYKKAYYTKNRFTPQYSLWRKRVVGRDRYKCVLCGSNNRIQAHHILRWIHNPIERFKVDNGVTLCYECHSKNHNYNGEEFSPELTSKLINYTKERQKEYRKWVSERDKLRAMRKRQAAD